MTYNEEKPNFKLALEKANVLITTSYIDKQAYEEVVEDGHPILIVTAVDIAAILRRNSIDSTNVLSWLTNVDKNNPYYQSVN